MKAARLAATVHAARALFTISTSVRDELVARFKVIRNGDGASPPCGRRRQEPGGGPPRRSTSGRRIVSIGRFTPHKNHRRLIDAFARTRFAVTGGEYTSSVGPSTSFGSMPRCRPESA